MNFNFIDIDDSRWPELLGQLRHDLYHSPNYARIEARRMNAAAEAFTAKDGDRLFFLPYLVRPCGPLFPDATVDTLDVISPYGYPGMLVNEPGHDAGFA